MEAFLFDQILQAAVQLGTSDVHIKVGAPFMIRQGNDIISGTDAPLETEDIDRIVRRILEQAGSSAAIHHLKNIEDLTDFDTSFSLPAIGRFRVNIARQQNTLCLTLRVIPSKVPTIDQLGLPEVLKEIAMEPRGLILVTGATGSGKSTTLAAILDYINRTTRRKIVTIEDPIEFLIQDQLCYVNQREIGSDSASFAAALRASLRQNPDVIMVGELRDRETVEIALKASETGHAVFSTLHTSNAESTIIRAIGVFEPTEQPGMRLRLADSLKAIISQRLVPRSDKEGRVAAMEVMRMTTVIRERITLADTRGFTDLIEQGWNPYKMQTFDQHLTALYRKNIISMETGIAFASSPTNFKRNLMFEGS
ncbi:MAG: PilT/PilU family type 4a pilus ATPase [Calditrichaeota bacterium]|nr:PilT/PilU family type 4a pilus ATPase [Calditrichota bacterium]